MVQNFQIEDDPHGVKYINKYGEENQPDAGVICSNTEHAGRILTSTKDRKVEEKFERNFRVNREMRDEILVYDLFLTKFLAKMASKCRENAAKIWILGFRF